MFLVELRERKGVSGWDLIDGIIDDIVLLISSRINRLIVWMGETGKAGNGKSDWNGNRKREWKTGKSNTMQCSYICYHDHDAGIMMADSVSCSTHEEFNNTILKQPQLVR